MIRTELIEKLERVAPALSNTNLVPVLQHFWFSGEYLACYNDQIAILTPLRSNFRGAVPATLISLLSVSRAKDVEFQDVKSGILTVKAASSKFKLPYLDEKATEIFTMPEADEKKALPVDVKAFIEAVSSCMRSLKEDTSIPDSMGVTLAYNKKGIDLFATNDATISTSRVNTKREMDDFRVVISGDFCRQMLSLAKLDGAKHLEIHDNYSLFVCGDNTLFGKLVDVQRPLDFDQVIDDSFSREIEAQLIEIPSKLELILDRAIVITDSKQDRPKTDVTIEKGVAKFFSQSVDRGEVFDTLQVPNHPDVSVSIDPRLFKAGYGFFDTFVLTEKCLVMSKGANLYLVSASH